MKFQKPSESSMKNTAAMAGGVGVGFMASKAVFGLIHNPPATTDATQQKKDNNTAMLKRGAFVLAGLGLAAALNGKDLVTTAVQSVGVGLAVHQGLELVATLAAKNNVVSENAARTTTGKMLARAVGLGCPCNEVAVATGLGNTIPFSPRFDMYAPSYLEDFTPLTSSGNLLERWGSGQAA